MNRMLAGQLCLLLCLLTNCRTPPEPAPATPAPAPTPSASPSVAADGTITLPSGLGYRDLVVGTGAHPTFNQTVVVRYAGWLENGKKVGDNLSEFKPPLDFKLGVDSTVIKGWHLGIGGGQGIEPMRVGGKRKLIIPPGLAYGDRGAGDLIPPNATLTFEVELTGARNAGGLGVR
jgi:FKBP-type peptidyl-prolyl cis-trans isomerase FkpA